MIVIVGSGLAGLVTALELVNQGFKVTIYEKDNEAGGMAKSKRINKNDNIKYSGIPTEHSWRGFMSFYYNTFDILKRIPLPNLAKERIISPAELKKHNTVDDAWILYNGYVYDITYFIKLHPGGSLINFSLGEDVVESWNKHLVGWHLKNKEVIEALTKNKIGKYTYDHSAFDTLVPVEMDMLYSKKEPSTFNLDIFYLIYGYLKYLFGNKRNHEDYKTKLLDVYGQNKISKYTFDYFINMLSGPGLGLDFNTASIGSIYFYFDGYLKHNSKSISSWYVTDRPSSEAFIEPLVELLLEKGVIINYQSELKLIDHDKNKNKINYLLINNEKVYADEYVIAINPNNLASIFEKSKMENLANQHWSLRSVNLQISFRLGFNKKINFKDTDRGYVLIDSENNITFYPQDNFFKVPIDINNNIKSLWSGTCVQVYNNTLKKEEFIENIINQFLLCQDLQNQIQKYNNFNLKRDDIVYTEIYDEWFYNGKSLESKNKKWVNTYFNDNFRPNNLTEYDNLYLTGGHTNTSFKIWSMESSCESGKRAANLILNKYKKPLAYLYTHTKPEISHLLSWLDDILYANNIGSVIDVLLWIIIYILLVKILQRRYMI